MNIDILKQVAEIKTELSMAQREIKRRKRAVDTLRKSEEKLRTIIEHSNELFYIHDISPSPSRMIEKAWMKKQKRGSLSPSLPRILWDGGLGCPLSTVLSGTMMAG